MRTCYLVISVSLDLCTVDFQLVHLPPFLFSPFPFAIFFSFNWFDTTFSFGCNFFFFLLQCYISIETYRIELRWNFQFIFLNVNLRFRFDCILSLNYLVIESNKPVGSIQDGLVQGLHHVVQLSMTLLKIKL